MKANSIDVDAIVLPLRLQFYGFLGGHEHMISLTHGPASCTPSLGVTGPQ
jgi:hypothetical protein